MRSVQFDVPGAAEFEKAMMAKRVKAIAKEVYDTDIDLSGVDLQNYYRADGAKITKSLSSLLRQKISKEEVQEKFATFAKHVAELYTIGLTLRAEFGDKKLIGEGVYESGKTCFRSDGENVTSKKFIVNNRRCAAIVLYVKGKKEPGGRCLAYFAGNRHVYLTNFYWRHIPQNKVYFITALRHLLGIGKVLYRQNPKFFLPIFKNGDSVLVYDERTRPIVPTRKLSCPHCGDTVPEGELFSEEISSYRVVGCTKECARKHSKIFGKCHSCKGYFLTQSMHSVNNKFFCTKCVRTLTIPCSACGNSTYREEMKEVDGEPLCKNCHKKSRCMVCKKVITDSCNEKNVGDSKCCTTCLPKSGHFCMVCRSISASKLPSRKVVGMVIPICDECAAPLPGTIMEAQGRSLAEAR